MGGGGVLTPRTPPPPPPWIRPWEVGHILPYYDRKALQWSVQLIVVVIAVFPVLTCHDQDISHCLGEVGCKPEKQHGRWYTFMYLSNSTKTCSSLGEYSFCSFCSYHWAIWHVVKSRLSFWFIRTLSFKNGMIYACQIYFLNWYWAIMKKSGEIINKS